jgi:hypothetical protein
MRNFNNDFDFFWKKIVDGDNFTFTRYADGEVMLMNGIAVGNNTQAYNVDKWNSPNKLTKVGKELLTTMNHTEGDYYYAISATSDSSSDYNFLSGKIKQTTDNITFVNLWINANYGKMKTNYSHLKRDVIVLCNHKAKKENFPFNVTDITPFPDDCINFWENNSEEFITDILEKYGSEKDKLFFISCGPVSEIIIHRLYENNPNNTYVDVGSSIDEFVHGKITRPFMDPNSIYGKMVSKF